MANDTSIAGQRKAEFTGSANAERFYVEHYEMAAWVKLLPGQKQFVGDRNRRICRFCNRGRPEATFRNRAHAFPEFIGNRVLFAFDECGSCNSRFANFEDHLSKYLGLELTISQIKGKNRVPKYRTRDGGPSVRFDRSAKRLLAASHVDDRFIDIDTQRELLTIRWRRQPYIPRLAFKCLVKMALSIAPQEILPKFSETIRWLLSEASDTQPAGSVCFTLLRSRSVKSLGAFEAVLLARNAHSNDLPYATFFISFSNFSFQIFVPFSSGDTNLIDRQVSIPRMPSKMEKVSEVFYLIEDMASHETLQNDVAELHLAYDGPITVTKQSL
jgi:hypothetical protein